MKKFDEFITDKVRRVAVVGHQNPDGDCLGSITAVYRYLHENYPEITVYPFADEAAPYIEFLKEDVPVLCSDGKDADADLAIAVDASSLDRIGAGKCAFQNGKHKIVIDHHETNTHFADENTVVPFAASTTEILTEMFTEEKISRETAISLYTGIIHDTGVFRYSCTTENTLKAAAMLIKKGVPFDRIIRDSVTEKPLNELQFIGSVLASSEYIPEKEAIVAYAPLSLQEKYGLQKNELGDVITYLQTVKETEFACFFYQCDANSWKCSMRSKKRINVSEIAFFFGGGGHERAAGFSFFGNPQEMLLKIFERFSQNGSLK